MFFSQCLQIVIAVMFLELGYCLPLGPLQVIDFGLAKHYKPGDSAAPSGKDHFLIDRFFGKA